MVYYFWKADCAQSTELPQKFKALQSTVEQYGHNMSSNARRNAEKTTEAKRACTQRVMMQLVKK